MVPEENHQEEEEEGEEKGRKEEWRWKGEKVTALVPASSLKHHPVVESLHYSFCKRGRGRGKCPPFKLLGL